MGKPVVRKPRVGRLGPLVWPIAALLGVLLFNLLFTQGFFHIAVKEGHLYGSLIDIANRAAPVTLLSLGMTLVLATGGVDLSVGAVMAISGAVAALLVRGPGLSVVAVMAAALGVSALAGMWNGALVAFLDIQPIVATLILMVAGRGVAMLLTNGQIITFENPPFEFVGGGFLFGLPFPITIALAALILIGAATRLTAVGLFIEAVGGNATASRLAGVDARAVKLFAYVVCGLCAGMAGTIVTSDIKAADANNVGLYLELDAILAAVIGGTSLSGGRFSLVGSVIGALLIQSLTTTILTRGIAVELTLVVKALVILAVCLLQSEALRRMLVQSAARRSAEGSKR
jgi:simple sugar transport system permease protein